MACDHDWEHQHDHSRTGTISRYKCRVCGVWAWQNPSNKWDGYMAKPIRPYKGPVTEPERSWLRPDLRPKETFPTERLPRRQQLSIVDWAETPMEHAVYGADRFIDPGEL